MKDNSVLLIGSKGYIGSYLEIVLRKRYKRVTTVDILPGADILRNYHLLTPAEVVYHDTVILLAAHSSVQMSFDWYSTYTNNVKYFADLLYLLPPDIKVIYASSGSVSNGHRNHRESEPINIPLNPYDATKIMGDKLAQISHNNYYGLRFGTVCGKSPNQRMDLLLQKMAWNAVNKGQVNVFNASSERSVLSLIDLAQAVLRIIEGESHPGIYNLASFDTNMISAAVQVCKKFNAKIEPHTRSPGTYTFTLNCDKIKEVYGYSPISTIESILDEFSVEYLESIKEEELELYSRKDPHRIN